MGGIDILLPGYSLVLIIICLNVIRAAHPNNADFKIWTFRLVILIVLAGSPILAKTVYQMIIWVLWLLCVIALVATDVESEQKRQDEKHHLRERRHAAKMWAEEKQRQEALSEAAVLEQEEKEEKHGAFRRHVAHMQSGVGIM